MQGLRRDQQKATEQKVGHGNYVITQMKTVLKQREEEVSLTRCRRPAAAGAYIRPLLVVAEAARSLQQRVISLLCRSRCCARGSTR